MAGTKQIGEAIVKAIQRLEANGDRISKEQLIYTMNAEMKRILPNWNSSIFLQQCSITREQIEQVEREVMQDRVVYDAINFDPPMPATIFPSVVRAALGGMQQATEPTNEHDAQIQAVVNAAEDARRRGLLEEANRAYAIAQEMRERDMQQIRDDWSAPPQWIIEAGGPTGPRVVEAIDQRELLRRTRQRTARPQYTSVVICPQCEIGYAHEDTTQCHHCTQNYCNGCLPEHLREMER